MSVFADRFELKRRVSAGSQSEVWRAVDEQTGDTVALKIFICRDPLVRQRCVREIGVLLSLRHPCVVRHVASGETEAEKVYLAMEWIEGRDLEELVREGPLPIEGALRLGIRVASALGAAHQHGVVHRDVTSRNIRLGQGIDDAKLIDFGLARPLDSTAVTSPGTFLGTPRYVAPEQARGLEPDVRSDLFSLGCILYRCISGVHAFDAEEIGAVLLKSVHAEAVPLSTHRPDVPPELERIIAQMMMKNPDERPANGAEVSERLARVLEQEFRPVGAVRFNDRAHPSQMYVVGSPEAGAGALLGSARAFKGLVMAVARRFAGRIEKYGDQLAISISPAPDLQVLATDVAGAAAKLALELAQVIPTLRLALVEAEELDQAFRRAQEVLAGVPTTGGAIGLQSSVRGLLSDRFLVDDEPSVPVLRGQQSFRDPGARDDAAPPFVGRRRQIKFMTEMWEASKRWGMTLLLAGEAGIGKSRLITELVAELRDAEPGLRVYAAEAQLAGAPLDVLRQLLRDEDAVVDAIERSAPTLAVRASDASRGQVPVEALAPVVEDLADFLAGRIDENRIIIIDNAHWADFASLFVLMRAVERVPESKSFIVLVTRHHGLESIKELIAKDILRRVLVLPPLSSVEVERVAATRLGTKTSATRLAEIARFAQGNPRLAEELAARAPAELGEAPDVKLAELLADRLTALTKGAQNALRFASLFGVRVPRAGLSFVASPELGQAVCDEALVELVDQGVLISRAEDPEVAAGDVRFANPALREVLYGGLDSVARERGHERVAGWLMSQVPQDATVIASHLEAAGLGQAASQWYDRGASMQTIEVLVPETPSPKKPSW